MALKGRRATYEERVQACRSIEAGNSPDVVADVMGFSRSSVFTWWRGYRLIGPESLRTKKARGPESKLTDDQMRILYALVTGASPDQLQFDFGLWTRKLIGQLILREFKVRLSESTVGRVLCDLGLSPQRPVYRAWQQNADKVREWKEETYPALRAQADKAGAEILFADEASVRTDFHAGTTWAPIGQTPVVRATGERKAIKMVSAISPRGLLRFQIHEGSMNAKRFIVFLKALLKDLDRPIFLVVDGSSVHKAKIVKAFVESTEGRLQLVFLPPYSPDLNPDEWVWKNVKHDRIGRAVAQSVQDLKALALSALRRLQKSPHILRGIFRDPRLAYIAG
jgi:transposase